MAEDIYPCPDGSEREKRSFSKHSLIALLQLGSACIMACNASGTFSAAAASTPLKFVESPHPRVKAARGRGVARKSSSSCSPCRSHAIMPLPKTLLNQRGFYVTANNSAKKTTYVLPASTTAAEIQINPTDCTIETIKSKCPKG